MLATHLTANLVADLLNGLDLDSDESSSASSSDDSAAEKYQEDVLHLMERTEDTRYLKDREPITKFNALMSIFLKTYKTQRPDLFRLDACINPSTFDRLIERLQNHPSFQNNSHQNQMPVDQHNLIVLKRFGTYGNGMTVQGVAQSAGVGKGTVDLVTRRVM